MLNLLDSACSLLPSWMKIWTTHYFPGFHTTSYTMEKKSKYEQHGHFRTNALNLNQPFSSASFHFTIWASKTFLELHKQHSFLYCFVISDPSFFLASLNILATSNFPLASSQFGARYYICFQSFQPLPSISCLLHLQLRCVLLITFPFRAFEVIWLRNYVTPPLLHCDLDSSHNLSLQHSELIKYLPSLSSAVTASSLFNVTLVTLLDFCAICAPHQSW